jgi:hypothetical protein
MRKVRDYIVASFSSLALALIVIVTLGKWPTWQITWKLELTSSAWDARHSLVRFGLLGFNRICASEMVLVYLDACKKFAFHLHGRDDTQTHGWPGGTYAGRFQLPPVIQYPESGR